MSKAPSAKALLAENASWDVFETLGSPLRVGLSIAAPTVSDPLAFNLDDYVGFTFRDKPILDLNGVKSHIDSGTILKTPNGIITYSFTDHSHLTGLYNNPTIGFTAGYGFSPFNTAQQAEARDSIKLWDDLVKPTFVEKNGTGADIQFGNSYDPAQAYAYYPGSKGYKFQSDVFVADPAVNWTNAWLGYNGYGATTLIHELGHTLGLSHPGAYNYDPNLDLTYDNYAEYAQDSTQYTIMSYWSASETGARIVDWSTFLLGNAQTPLVHDIVTIQAKYGADPTTRAGNTTYGFNTNAGNEVYDFSKNAYPYLSIYDAGGVDTLDLSGFNAGAQIDLHAGSFSSAGQALVSAATVNANDAALDALGAGGLGTIDQATVDAVGARYIARNAASIAADTGVSGVNATEYMNLSIAYGTTIENATGTTQRDVLWGNEVANVIKGLGGNDVIDGFEGKDTLYGGAGADVFQFTSLKRVTPWPISRPVRTRST